MTPRAIKFEDLLAIEEIPHADEALLSCYVLVRQRHFSKVSVWKYPIFRIASKPGTSERSDLRVRGLICDEKLLLPLFSLEITNLKMQSDESVSVSVGAKSFSFSSVLEMTEWAEDIKRIGGIIRSIECMVDFAEEKDESGSWCEGKRLNLAMDHAEALRSLFYDWSCVVDKWPQGVPLQLEKELSKKRVEHFFPMSEAIQGGKLPIKAYRPSIWGHRSPVVKATVLS